MQWWLSDTVPDVPLLDSDIEQIATRLCGWPQAMYEFRDVLSAKELTVPHISDLLDQTVERLRNGTLFQSMLRGAKAENMEKTILSIFHEYQQDAGSDDIYTLLEHPSGGEVSMDRVRNVMRWMEYQGLLHPAAVQDDSLFILQTKRQRGKTRNDRYVADPLVMELWVDD